MYHIRHNLCPYILLQWVWIDLILDVSWKYRYSHILLFCIVRQNECWVSLRLSLKYWETWTVSVCGTVEIFHNNIAKNWYNFKGSVCLSCHQKVSDVTNHFVTGQKRSYTYHLDVYLYSKIKSTFELNRNHRV